MGQPRDIARVAKEKLGFASLRPGQEEVVRLVLQGRDVLSVMPTGSGKSAIYQIAALMIDGPTVVVSPLIALQKDQVESIEEKDLPEAAVVNSTVKTSDRREAFAMLAEGELEFLFLAPEQLANEDTMAKLKASPPSLLVVDEAHCVSEWGQDFRPEYGRIGKMMEALPKRPIVLALTATAAPNVREQIIDKLALREPEVVVWGFDRPNIHLQVEKCEDVETKRRVLLQRVKDLPKPGIVYVATQAATQELALDIREELQIAAEGYHGGMNKAERGRVQDAFMDGAAPVIVATNAFGMGVDKPDVRFVIHYDIPESIDAYFQEVGRAGRDGRPAEAILLYRAADVGRRRAQASGAKLSEDEAEQVAKTVAEEGGVHIDELKEKADLPAAKVEAAVRRMEELGAMEVTEAGDVIASTDDTRELVDKAEEAAKDHDAYRQYRLGRVQMMQDYATTGDCRRRYLLNYFGQHLRDACGNCDNCETGVVQEEVRQSGEHPFPLKSRVTHRKWGPGTVMSYEGDKVEVLFDKEGTKSVVTRFVIDNKLMEPA